MNSTLLWITVVLVVLATGAGHFYYARLRRSQMLQRWPEALLLVNKHGRILLSNPQACYLLSLSPAQLQQQTLEQLMGPQKVQPGAWPVRLQQAQGTPLHVQCSLWSHRQHSYLLRLRPLNEAELAEPELRLSHDLLQRSALDAGIAAWSWDPRSNELHWSDQVFALLGLDPATFAPNYEHYLALVHSDDRQRYHKAAQAALEAPQPYSIEYRIERPDGELITLLEHNQMQFDAQSKLHTVWGTITDISERRLLETRLNLSSLAIDACTQGVLICDHEYRPQLVNPAFCRMTGFPKEALMEPGWSMLSQSRESPEESLACLEESLDGDRWYGELWLHGIKGRSRSVLVSRTLVRDSQGDIRQRIYICTDITQLKLQQEQLQLLAYRDPLTGLPNRLLFDDRLLQSLQYCQRQEKPLALAFIDLNGFKTINDQLGHNAGDKALCEVAQTLQALVRESDTVARWGGDEFAILMPACGEHSATIERLDALAHSLRQQHQASDGSRLTISASIGVAFFPADATRMDSLLELADQRMYQAKRSGQMLVACDTPEPKQPA